MSLTLLYNPDDKTSSIPEKRRKTDTEVFQTNQEEIFKSKAEIMPGSIQDRRNRTRKAPSLTNLSNRVESKPRGKTKSNASDYQEKCNTKLKILKEKMEAIGDKKNLQWQKLRKQKIAYEARLRNRMHEDSRKKQVLQAPAVSKALLKMALAVLPPEKQLELRHRISTEVQDDSL